MAVIPDSKDIAPGAKPWARWHDQQAQDNTDAITRLTQSTKNTLASIAASINKLSQQVSVLQSFQTFSTFDNTFITTTTTGTLNAASRTMVLNFTLARPGVVLLQMNADFTGTSNAAASGSVNAQGDMSVIVDGSNVALPSIGGGISVTATGVTNLGYFNNVPFTKVFVQNLATGAHTVTVTWRSYFNGTTGSAQVGNTSIVASVIG